MKTSRLAVPVVLIALVASTLAALAQGPAPGGPGSAPIRRTPIATVGTRTVYREELDRRTVAALAQFMQRNGNRDLPPEMRDLLRRQVLEGMIRLELLALEAKRTGVTASPLEAEEVLKQDPFFNPNGHFDASRFMAIKTTQMPAYNAAISSIQEQVAARKLNDQLEARFRPDDATLRAQTAHDLTHLSLDHLSLRTAEFSGAYAEPRESDVLDYWRAHQADYERVDRAELSVSFINRPALSDSVKRQPGGETAWSRRMKTVADSLLAVIQKGGDFVTTTAPMGSPASVAVTSDNFPGYWKGTAAQNAELFRPANVGKTLPAPIPATEGWLLVRVENVTPAHVAPVREVAREIRGILRRDRRQHRDENDERVLYASLRDSLAGPGWRIRYAFAETGAQHIPEPTLEEMDHYYRGHLADYSSFDAATSSVQAKSFESVRSDVRARWQAEQGATMARGAAERLYAAWSAGRSDAALEASLGARDAAPAPRGVVLDTTYAARALGDSLWAPPAPAPAGMINTPRGWVVWRTLGKLERVVPTFEQSREELARRMALRQDVEDEAGAHKMFDADPAQFRTGNVEHFQRIAITPPPLLGVKLTRAEVVKWHHDHIDKFSAPELVRARHILISPKNASAEADRAAYATAKALLVRAKAGESFEKLAHDNSDDPATKDKGGDLGTFGRGVMLDAFENAVFALEPGQIAPEPVKTEVGYHVILCLEHAPAVAQPLEWIYTLVGIDAAQAKAEQIAEARADSFLRVYRTPAALVAAARARGIGIVANEHRIGDPAPTTTSRPYFQQLDAARPGEILRPGFKVKGQGVWITWIDGISPPSTPSWEDSRGLVIETYRRGAGTRALKAKMAELDSLNAGGWSFDSLAALWGGPEHVRDLPAGRGLPGMGGAALLDSVAFGGTHGPVLQAGQVSGWLAFPNGYSRVRVTDRAAPASDQVAARAENARSAALETKLRDYFEALQRRWPVRILDPKLRDMTLVAPNQGPPGN